MTLKLVWFVPVLVGCSRPERAAIARGQPIYRASSELANIVEHQAYHDDVLLNLHDSGWSRVPLPKPPNGKYYTRGDMLEGFRGISDSGTFRLLGAGAAWRWSGDSAWSIEQRPPADAWQKPLRLPVGSVEDVIAASGAAFVRGRKGELDSDWRKLFDDPTDSTSGEQHAFIAEYHGLVAFATTTVPQLERGSSDKFVQSGS